MRFRKLALTSCVLGLLMVACEAAPALAYSPSGAAAYADQWAHGYNSNYMRFSDDCTNFVSQALHSGGGYSYVGSGDSFDDGQWWAHWSPYAGFSWTHSWSVSSDQWQFQMQHFPGGYSEGSAHTEGAQTAAYTPANEKTGDELFYDLNGDGTIDHAGIQVGIGTDNVDPGGSGWYGNLQDQHSTARKHAFWSLLPYNSQWATTTVYFVHIDSTNR